MILCVLSVRDRSVDTFGAPIFVVHINRGIRGFADALKDPQSEFAKHPGDYDLFELGSFDDQTGVFTNLPKARQVAIGKDLVGA